MTGSRADAAAGEDRLAELLGGVAAGDRNALADLYADTSAQLLGIVHRVLHRRDLAEEVLHDAYLRIWHNAATYAPERGRALTWMVAIARHAAFDRLRRGRRELPLDQLPDYDETPDDAPDPHARMLESAEGQALVDCLSQLDPEPRQCILLAYHHGLTHQELARRFDRPLGTVKSWVRRALLRLRDCLGA